jgi:hypothetical protein
MGMKGLLLPDGIQSHFCYEHLAQGATDMSMVPCCVGLDYHDDSIRVCIVDEDGMVLYNRNVENSPVMVELTVRRFAEETTRTRVARVSSSATWDDWSP